MDFYNLENVPNLWKGKTDEEVEELYDEMLDLYKNIESHHKKAAAHYKHGNLGVIDWIKEEEERANKKFEIAKYVVTEVGKEVDRRKKKRDPLGYYLGKLNVFRKR